jgi:hypothetical protein
VCEGAQSRGGGGVGEERVGGAGGEHGATVVRVAVRVGTAIAH